MATTLLFDATVSQHVAFLLAQNERLVLPFLRLALEMAYPFLRRDSEAGGSTKGAITCEELGNFKIAFPRQDEQRSIVAFCAVEAAKIDALVAEQERLIELLKEKRQIVISHAVTKGLNPAAPMKDSGIEWLGQVPAHWSALRLRWLYRQQKRQGFQHLPVLSVYRDYGVILKDSRSDNINKTPEDVSAYQLVAPGDLVVNKMKAWQGSLGVSTLEGITSPDYAVFTPLLPHHGAFLHHLLRSQAIVTTYRGLSSGIRPDQWRLEPDAFLGLSIYLPSIEEQKAIAEHIVASAGKFDALMEEAERAVILLQERRAALISAAVTGQIDVRNQGVVSAA
jgi:type I restriction enzyme S subunit